MSKSQQGPASYSRIDRAGAQKCQPDRDFGRYWQSAVQKYVEVKRVTVFKKVWQNQK